MGATVTDSTMSGTFLSEPDAHADAEPRHRERRERRHRVLKAVAICVAVILVVVATGGFLAYQHLNGNITKEDITKKLGTDRPTEKPRKKGVKYKAENILLLGSDTRQGQSGKKIGGATPGLSDTTILLHVSADRKLAYGVSLPRDAMVHRPWCQRKGKGNGIAPAAFEQFNEAYAKGGAGCTAKTVEQLTGVFIDHYMVIDFTGFKKVVNALGGVQVCVPNAVDDTTGHIQLKAGTYNVKGEQALDYVRVRHDLGVENGDIGRMKRQQTFLASMANKAVSAKTLVNVPRLYKVLDAATKSLTTDPGLGSVKKLASMARSLNGIGLSHIQFLTVPFEEYPPDHNRLQWALSAKQLWKRIIDDQPVGKQFQDGLTTAANKDGKSAKKKGSSASPSPSATAAAERAAELRRQNGLCA